MRLLLVAISLAVAAAGVAGCSAPPESSELPPPPLPPGDALPPDVDAMLFGSTQTCRRDTDCPSEVCYFGSCVGLLLADQRWMQDTMAAALAETVGEREGLRERVLDHLKRMLDRESTDVAYRGRALVALEALEAREELAVALASADEPLSDAAALSLARLGDERGLERALVLTRHQEVAVGMEALRSLGTLSGDPSLVELLSHLNPALDSRLLGAAVDALGELGDKRAVGPLIGFASQAAPHLRHRVGASLHRLTGEVLGADPQAWAHWSKGREVPPSPAVTLRSYSAASDFGFPAP